MKLETKYINKENLLHCKGLKVIDDNEYIVYSYYEKDYQMKYFCLENELKEGYEYKFFIQDPIGLNLMQLEKTFIFKHSHSYNKAICELLEIDYDLYNYRLSAYINKDELFYYLTNYTTPDDDLVQIPLSNLHTVSSCSWSDKLQGFLNCIGEDEFNDNYTEYLQIIVNKTMDDMPICLDDVIYAIDCNLKYNKYVTMNDDEDSEDSNCTIKHGNCTIDYSKNILKQIMIIPMNTISKLIGKNRDFTNDYPFESNFDSVSKASTIIGLMAGTFALKKAFEVIKKN